MQLLKLISIIFISTFIYSAAADMAVTVAGAGDGSGTAGDGVTLEWDNAMSLAQWEADMEASTEAGDRYFIAGGTYTLTGAFSVVNDGTKVNYIHLIGVDSGTTAEPPTSSDWSTGTDRPLIAAGGNDFIFDNYYMIRNIRLTSTDQYGIRLDSGAKFINCKSTNSSESAGRSAFYAGAASAMWVNCEAISTLGNGFNGTNYLKLYGCYAHDSDRGMHLGGDENIIVNCIIDTCVDEGIFLNDEYGSFISNNTIYNCDSGIEATVTGDAIIVNNIIDNCETGVLMATLQDSCYLDYNNFKNNTADVTNATKGANTLALDPGFTNAGAGDFSLDTTLKSAGFPGEFPGGLSTGYIEPGAVQREEAGAGGGETSHAYVN